MNLVTLAHLLHVPPPSDPPDEQITTIACRPSQLVAGGLYGVVDEYLDYGRWVHGLELLSQLPDGQAGAILSPIPLPWRREPVLVVADPRKALALASREILGRPDDALQVIGITGTKGKTTTSHLIRQWLELCGIPAAALGTLGLHLPDGRVIDTTYTTPLAPDLFYWLDQARQAGAQGVAMEISSHAIKLDRCHGLHLAAAVLTNLTRDHLDFHKTWEDYRDTKRSLFTDLPRETPGVINLDDPLGQDLAHDQPGRFLTYSMDQPAWLTCQGLTQTARGLAFEVRENGQVHGFEAPLLGRFNVENLLASLAVCLSMGIPMARLAATAPRLRGVPGRLEMVPLPEERVGVVDFAHTPDSLEKILQTLRLWAQDRRLITVFGCGGDRDRGKRPLMGAVAARLSDLCVVTSDNPRSEDPEAILAEILATMDRPGIHVEVDRHRAIQKAYALSQPGDILLLAGKGHETTQIFKDHTVAFSDRRELEALAGQRP